MRLMAVKDPWITEEMVEGILDIIQKSGTGEVELDSYRDSMYALRLS
jgi:hypothetical protein